MNTTNINHNNHKNQMNHSADKWPMVTQAVYAPLVVGGKNGNGEGAATPAPKGEAAHGVQSVYAPLGVGGKNGNGEL
jgi:hypothetical protein